jgi:Ca-activated chloride channel homolog|tara:strand:+ start:23155 stop:24180 length:1026 start_codon:yes stop_codon:yes gene_type:complete
MIDWHWPWAFYLLPLPLLIFWILPKVKRQEAALKVPSLSLWETSTNSAHIKTENTWPTLILPTLLWLALLTALARPHILGETVELPTSGRDLMLAIDLSGSMAIEDMQLKGRPVNRLSTVKNVLNDFISERQGDRIGLVLFGSQAYLQSPLTFDWQTVQTLMNEAQIGLAGKQTAIGDAIGLTIKRLQSHPEQSRVVILLTDGANTAGEVEPLKAAELAQQSHVKIYTIGLGADSMKVSSFFGSRQVNPSRDLDEKSLQQIAEITGGHYFRARDSEELEQIYDMIDQLEPTEKDPEIFRPQINVYFWPLAAALLISFLMALQAIGLFRHLNHFVKTKTRKL